MVGNWARFEKSSEEQAQTLFIQERRWASVTSRAIRLHMSNIWLKFVAAARSGGKFKRPRCSHNIDLQKAFDKSAANSIMGLENVLQVPNTTFTHAVRVFLTPEKDGMCGQCSSANANIHSNIAKEQIQCCVVEAGEARRHENNF